jgi:hypothetical protein
MQGEMNFPIMIWIVCMQESGSVSTVRMTLLLPAIAVTSSSGNISIGGLFTFPVVFGGNP